MRFKSYYLYLSLIFAFSMSPLLVSAQEESDIPANSTLMYGKVKIEDQKVFISFMVPVAETRQRTVTVQVPVTIQYEVEGELRTKTEMRTEERAETYEVMVNQLTTQLIEPGTVNFQTISRTKVSFDQLSAYDDKPVLILLGNAAKITPYHQQLYNAETLVAVEAEPQGEVPR